MTNNSSSFIAYAVQDLTVSPTNGRVCIGKHDKHKPLVILLIVDVCEEN